MGNPLWEAALVQANWTWERALNRCVELALEGIPREFPCQLPLILSQPQTLTRPRDVTPVFYGCYDWHSAVHNHWLLLRALRVLPSASWREAALRLLTEQFTAAGLQAEAAFLSAPYRQGFERPYGLAWLLQLAAEVRHSKLKAASRWSPGLQPLVTIAVERFLTWLPRLSHPIRTGEHSQTAFAMGLAYDWATAVARDDVCRFLRETALRFHRRDRHLPVALEPSGHDFLSPSLSVADLFRRFLSADELSEWLTTALPEADSSVCLWEPVQMVDATDGKLAHFAGLNFSRAWMLARIATGLPLDDRRRSSFLAMAMQHLAAGLPVLDCQDYAVTHWVNSFACYALTTSAN